MYTFVPDPSISYRHEFFQIIRYLWMVTWILNIEYWIFLNDILWIINLAMTVCSQILVLCLSLPKIWSWNGTVNYMSFFAFFLRKLEPSCEIGVYSVAILGRVLYRKWPPLALSLSQYRALFADITSTRRCGTPVLERRSCASPRKRIPMTGKPSLWLALKDMVLATYLVRYLAFVSISSSMEAKLMAR